MPRSAALAAVWAGAALLLGLHAAHFHHLVDDAFISFRYLDNWVAGHGLVYNVGERVEGYTNFLWIVVLGVAHRMGVAPQQAAPVLGVAAMAGALTVRWCTQRELATTLTNLGGLVATCCCAPIAYWAAGGLETGLFCLLIMGVLAAVASERLLLAGFLSALLCMTRPDGIVYVGAAGLWLLTRKDRARVLQPRTADIAQFSLVFLIAYVPYFLWRWSYYDALLPNTFYAKVGGGGAAVFRGLEYVGAFILLSGSGALLLILAFINRLRTDTVDETSSSSALRALVLLFVAAAVAFVLLVGGDQLAMFRFAVPVLVLAYPPTVMFFLNHVSPRYRIVVLALICALTLAPSFVGPMVQRVEASERPADEARKIIGLWLKHHTDPETLIAVVPAGILPYYAERTTVDLVGLNDRHIARAEVQDMGRGAPGHERYDADYVMQRKPDIVFLGACLLRDRPLGEKALDEYVRRYGAFAPAVLALYEHPQFHKLYEPRALPIDGRFAHVWVRKGYTGWRGPAA